MSTSRPSTPRHYRGLSAELRKHERRERLIQAGHALFGRDGYHAASVKAICQQAGLTERYFYESFSNREALFADVYLAATLRLRERLLAAVDRAAPDMEAMAAAGSKAFFSALQRDPHGARIMLFELLGISPDIDRLYRRETHAFADIFGRAIPAPARQLPAEELSMIAIGLVGATIQIAMRWVLENYRPPLKTVVASCLRIYAAVGRDLLAAPPATLKRAARRGG